MLSLDLSDLLENHLGQMGLLDTAEEVGILISDKFNLRQREQLRDGVGGDAELVGGQRDGALPASELVGRRRKQPAGGATAQGSWP